jgi:curved DNA-binding protein CbpA
MPRESEDPYAVLGLPPTATQDEITNAYRRQVRTLHPDVTTSQSALPPSDEQLRRVLAAYALLRDPERRAALRRPTAPPAPTNTRKSAATVRIPGLTVGFRVRWLSE